MEPLAHLVPLALAALGYNPHLAPLVPPIPITLVVTTLAHLAQSITPAVLDPANAPDVPRVKSEPLPTPLAVLAVLVLMPQLATPQLAQAVQRDLLPPPPVLTLALPAPLVRSLPLVLPLANHAL